MSENMTTSPSSTAATTSSSPNTVSSKNSIKPTSIDFTKYGSVPEDKLQYIVQTPYGRGMVVRTHRRNYPQVVNLDNDNDKSKKESKDNDDTVIVRELELVDWHQQSAQSTSSSQQQERPALLYTSQQYPSVPAQVGDEVTTIYGRGVVTETRKNNKINDETDDTAKNDNNNSNNTCVVVVKLTSWRLADRSRVICYLSPSAVQVVRHKRAYEMDVFERVDYSTQLKEQASKEFSKSKNYHKALQLYSRAVDVVRYVQHDSRSTNHVRADLLLVMVTCSNNAATCCVHLSQYDEAYKFALNAAILIESLQERKQTSKINQILQKDGTTDIKFFGEYYVKSLLLQAKALANKNENVQAISVLKKAHDVIASYTAASNEGDENNKNNVDSAYQKSVQQLLNNDKEVKRLHVECKERRKIELQKEKLRAQAMFASNNDGIINETKTSNGVSNNNSSSNNNNNNNEAISSITTEANNSTVEEIKETDESVSSSPPPSALRSSSFNKTEEYLPQEDFEQLREMKKKRKVSFADQLDELDKKDSVSLTAKDRDDDKTLAAIDEGWDAEVITGLGLAAICFVGAAVASNYIFNIFASRKR